MLYHNLTLKNETQVSSSYHTTSAWKRNGPILTTLACIGSWTLTDTQMTMTYLAQVKQFCKQNSKTPVSRPTTSHNMHCTALMWHN